MKKLNELYSCEYDIEIYGIKINSKEVVKGDLFVCTMGVMVDRHLFVDDAIKNGAVAIIASKKIDVNVPVIYVDNTNFELPRLMSLFCEHPEEKISLVGITGTNGKTTVAEMIQDILGDSVCGYIGTNGISCASFNESIRNTTPDADRLYPYFRKLVDSGCKYISLETSSEAFFRNRLDLLEFDVSVFTNMQEDHLNIHKTIENYVDCKCELFRKTKESGTCILNRDDAYYETFFNASSGTVITYGTNKDSDLYIQNIKLFEDKTEFNFTFKNENYQIVSPFISEFNVMNLCASILAAYAFGISMENILARINNIEPILGRLESLAFSKEYQIILDYAHTKDALEKVLSFLKKMKKGRIITVTGSAGGRETEKRPLMGNIVLEKSDHVIFTMDDPRNEDVNMIIDEMIGGSLLTNYERVISRPEAICKALSMALPGDIVLIVGKGRDNYMALRDEYVPYSDYDEIKKYFI